MEKKLKPVKEKVKEYYLSIIEPENELITEPKDKLQYLYNCFKEEYGFRTKQISEYKAFSEWLSGLAINIAFTNYDILEKAKEWGRNPKTEAQKYNIIKDWWDFSTSQYFILFKQNKIDYSIKQGSLHTAKKEDLKNVRVGDLATLISENNKKRM